VKGKQAIVWLKEGESAEPATGQTPTPPRGKSTGFSEGAWQKELRQGKLVMGVTGGGGGGGGGTKGETGTQMVPQETEHRAHFPSFFKKKFERRHDLGPRKATIGTWGIPASQGWLPRRTSIKQWVLRFLWRGHSTYRLGNASQPKSAKRGSNFIRKEKTVPEYKYRGT